MSARPRPVLVAPPEHAGAGWLRLREIATRYAMHAAVIERHVANGLPHIDVAVHRPGARLKRSLRFDPIACDRWFQERAR